MKKINYLLIVILLLIIGINRVNASSYNGKLYEVWDTESGVNVYASESNGYMDYNSWMIKSSIDNKIYYCIDPATPLIGSYVGSHNIYTDKDEIISNTSLTLEKYKKVQLLAYYGYGYKDDYVDHTSKKWYGITQVMIWRVMRPDLTWTFKENRNSVPDKDLYSSLVSELNKLVNDYSKFPSFANNTIKVQSGEKIILTDTNKVFHNYTLFSKSQNVKVEEDGDKLTLYSEYSTPYFIGYKIVSQTNDKFGALVSSDFQDIIRMGAPEEKQFNFILEVTGGFLNIQKVDRDTNLPKPSGNATLKGAEYEIYSPDGEVIKAIKTDENGLAKTGLPYGEYFLKEVKAPKGYKINNKEYSFTLSGRDNNITISVDDEVIMGTIKIIKLKGGADEKFVFEKDAVFAIFDKNSKKIEEIITNSDGIGMINLPYGTYTIKQIKGEEGYIFSDDFSINITKEKVYEFKIKNLKKSILQLSKKDYSFDIPVPNCLMEIYKDDNTLIYSGKTDKNGKIVLPNLDIGKYYILEKEAPKYYVLNTDKMFFEVLENGTIIKSTMTNKRYEGSLKIIKVDSNTRKPIEGVSFDIYLKDIDKVMFKGKTDKNGELIIDTMVAGKYCVIEKEPALGYIVNKKKYCFEIDGKNKNVVLNIKNKKNLVNVPKTSAFNIISIIGTLLILSGFSYLIYEKFN